MVARTKPKPIKREYPELDEVAEQVADLTAATINRLIRDVNSQMPYTAQYVLETVIKLLEQRV